VAVPEDGHVAEFVTQLLLLGFGLRVAVGEDLQQVQPVFLAAAYTDAAAVVVGKYG